MRLEVLGQLKNAMTSSGNRTLEVPACSIVSQPTTLPHSPALISVYSIVYVALAHFYIFYEEYATLEFQKI
jgi:hypothetical protein